MQLETWSNLSPVVERFTFYIEQVIYGEGEWDDSLTDINLQWHYVFYTCLYMMVRCKEISYKGNLPIYVPFGKKNILQFAIDYEESFFALICGVMEGCGIDIPVQSIYRVKPIVNGKSTYKENEQRMQHFFSSCMLRIPSEASAVWNTDIESIAEECMYYSYGSDAGALVMVWSYGRYHKIIEHLSKAGRQENVITKLKEKYCACMNLFTYFTDIEEVIVGGKKFFLEVMPATISSEYWGIVDSRTVFCMNLRAFHSMVELSYLLSEYESGITDGKVD